MSSSPPYPRSVQRHMVKWVSVTKDLLKSIETSGLVVTKSEPDSVSSALALAAIEITHGMLIMVGIGLGRPVEELRKEFPCPGGWRDVE